MLDQMLPYLSAYYGNPHSRTHAYGWESEEAVEVARKVCACIVWGHTGSGRSVRLAQTRW